MKMKTKSDIIFDVINYSMLAVIFFVAFYPLYFVVIASFSDPNYVNAGETLLFPKGINFDGYKKAFEFKQIWVGYKNSAIYTVVGTALNLVVLIPAAFALSRKELIGKKLITTFMLITMYFGGGTVPAYLNIKNLGLMDTMWALILPGAFSVGNMIICRSYFLSNVSEELFESVKLDGGGYARFFFSIVLPLSKAIVAVMILYHALGHWNVYITALYYIRDKDKFPLQLVLRNITTSLSNSTVDGGGMMDDAETEKLREMIRYSTILIAALPMIILYPFVQKHFTKGVMVGSVKG